MCGNKVGPTLLHKLFLNMFKTVSTKKKKHNPETKETTSQQNLSPFNAMVYYKTCN